MNYIIFTKGYKLNNKFYVRGTVLGADRQLREKLIEEEVAKPYEFIQGKRRDKLKNTWNQNENLEENGDKQSI